MLSYELLEGELPSTVVFLPGLFAGKWIWQGQIPFIRSMGHGVLVFSDAFCATKSKLTSLDHLCSLCEEVILANTHGQLVIAGNSVGGLLSIRLGARLADRVSGIVVSGAPGLSDEATAGLSIPNTIGLAVRNTITREYAQRIAEKIFFDQNRVVNSEIDQVFAAVRTPQSVLQMARILRFARMADVEGLLADLMQPTLLVWGREDAITPAEPWRELAARHREFQFHAIEKAGHCPMIEAASRFNTLASTFIREVLSTGMAERSTLVPAKDSIW